MINYLYAVCRKSLHQYEKFNAISLGSVKLANKFTYLLTYSMEQSPS
jgi:hypothetical protein